MLDSCRYNVYSNPSAPVAENDPPPPYLISDSVQTDQERQPLIQAQRDRLLSDTSSNFSLSDIRFDVNNVSGNPCGAIFWAIASGICLAGCRLLLANITLDAIEVTLVGSVVQILLSGMFVTLCQCHRLWPQSPARNHHKIFLVLFAFLSGIQALCSVVVFNKLENADAEFLMAFILVSTALWSCIMLREPIKIWKTIFILLFLAGLVVIEEPPMFLGVFGLKEGGPGHLKLAETGSAPADTDNRITIGMLAGVLGVAILGGLANVAVSATSQSIGNGLLIFYGGFASFLVGVLASRSDSGQRILSPKIIDVPIIDWILMCSHGLMMTVALTFFMNSIKASSPGIAQAVTKMSYISVLFAVQAIINQDFPETMTIIGLAVMIASSVALSVEYSISRRLPRFLQRCF